MILERAIFAIKPGHAEEFEAAFAKARPHIEGARGFRKLEMRPGIENPDDFLLLVWWDTVEDHMWASAKARPLRNGAPFWGRLFASRRRWSITTSRFNARLEQCNSARLAPCHDAMLAFASRREARMRKVLLLALLLAWCRILPWRRRLITSYKTVKIGGDGGFDYIVADSRNAGGSICARSGQTNPSPLLAAFDLDSAEAGRRISTGSAPMARWSIPLSITASPAASRSPMFDSTITAGAEQSIAVDGNPDGLSLDSIRVNARSMC